MLAIANIDHKWFWGGIADRHHLCGCLPGLHHRYSDHCSCCSHRSGCCGCHRHCDCKPDQADQSDYDIRVCPEEVILQVLFSPQKPISKDGSFRKNRLCCFCYLFFCFAADSMNSDKRHIHKLYSSGSCDMIFRKEKREEMEELLREF